MEIKWRTKVIVKREPETLIVELHKPNSQPTNSSFCMAIPGLELKSQMSVEGMVDLIETTNFGMYDGFENL